MPRNYGEAITASESIDVHAHIVQEHWFDEVRRDYPNESPRIKLEPNGRCSLTVRSNSSSHLNIPTTLFDMRGRIVDLKMKKIHMQVLSAVPLLFYYEYDPELALSMSRAQNEGIADLAKQNPNHFIGLSTVPLQQTDYAIKELERSIEKLGLKGVEIGTSINEMELDNNALWPFYEAAQRLDVPIMVHPTTVKTKFSARFKQYYLSNLIGNPTEVSLAISRLIFGGVFDAFPRLKFYFVHGGGFVPYQRGRLEQGYLTKRKESGMLAKKSPSNYMASMYFDTVIHYEPALQYLVESFGSNRLLCGTDYPFDMGILNMPARLRKLKIRSSDRALISYQNAKKLFKLN